MEELLGFMFDLNMEALKEATVGDAVHRVVSGNQCSIESHVVPGHGIVVRPDSSNHTL